MLKIRVKYFNDADPIHITDIGDWIDLKARETFLFKKDEYKAIPLGVAMQLPDNYQAIVAPRSSLFKNHGLICANSFGVIDESYCGNSDEWHFLVYATRPTMVWKGERICQFRLLEKTEPVAIDVVDFLDNPDRGGIGSTGRM